MQWPDWSSSSMPRRQHLGQARLATGPRCAASATADDRGDARPGAAGRGSTVPAHHLLHLVGHARHGVDHLVADRARPDPARCPAAAAMIDGARRAPRPGAGCSSGMSRPRDAEHRADAVLDDSASSSSSTPITSAMTSRVMSSWVGPEPTAHDHRVGLRSSALAQTPRDAVRSCRRPWSGRASRCRRARAARRSTTSWCRRSARAAARCRRPRPHSAWPDPSGRRDLPTGVDRAVSRPAWWWRPGDRRAGTARR